jgi:hypothetical protein
MQTPKVNAIIKFDSDFQNNQSRIALLLSFDEYDESITCGVACTSLNHRLSDVTAPQYFYGFPRNKHPVWGGHQETVERMGNTSHQAPSTSHQAPSTKHRTFAVTGWKPIPLL